MFLKIVGLPVQNVPQQSSSLVIQIVASGQDRIPLFYCRPVKMIPLDRPTGGTGRSMDPIGEVINAGTFFF